MKTSRSLTLALACLGALSVATPASAQLQWNWSFTGTAGVEAGTFRTNGTVADLSSSFNFVIDATTFQCTSSALAPSLVGQTFTDSPTTGFLWNGTKATQFYRDSGAWTNGSNFFSSPWRYTFFADSSVQQGSLFNNSTFEFTGPRTLTLTGGTIPSPSGVPELDASTASGCLALAAGVLALLESRRRGANLV